MKMMADSLVLSGFLLTGSNSFFAQYSMPGPPTVPVCWLFCWLFGYLLIPVNKNHFDPFETIRDYPRTIRGLSEDYPRTIRDFACF